MREEGEIASGPVGTLTSASLTDLKKLIVEVRQRRVSLREEMKVAVEARDSAYRWHWFRSRAPLHWFGADGILKAKAKSDDRQSALEEIANALSSCFMRLTFQMPPRLATAWRELGEAHDALSKSNRVWDITSEVGVDRVRTRSAASSSVKRKPVRLEQARIQDDVIATPETALRFGNVTGVMLDFYPGLCMVQGKNEFDLVSMLDIDTRHLARKFIETEGVPSDSRVIDHAWLKSNKDGSRDKRFASNRQIPIALYGALDFRSATGVNEAYMFSNVEATTRFASAFEAMKVAQRAQASAPPASTLEPDDEGIADAFTVTVPDPVMIPKWFLFTTVAVVLLGIAGATFRGSPAHFEQPRQAPVTTSPALQQVPAKPASPLVSPAPNPSSTAATPPGQKTSEVAAGNSNAPRLTVTAKIAANIRASGEPGAAVVGVIKAGDKLTVFARAKGWLQVAPAGSDKPIGWIWEGLISSE